MNRLAKRIDEEFKNCPDLIKKQIKVSMLKNIYVYYLETVSGSNQVNDYVLKSLSNFVLENKKDYTNLTSLLPSPNTVTVEHPDQIEFYLTNGFTIVFSDFHSEIIAIETKADINRAVSTPDSQPSVYGPKDAFTENYQINLGLLKRRIKSNTLATDELIIGRKSKTKVGIIYFTDIAEDKTVNRIKKKLKQIDVDALVNIGYVRQYIVNENKTAFPQVISTERPDQVASALLEGKIAIIMDTCPFVLILPAFFADFINPTVDDYSKSINVNFLKILRFLSLIITVLTPAFYIALTNYNQEALPTSLVVNFSMQRDGVPFPAIIEAIIMLIVCEILRESDLRFPNSYGSSISILGALILGEAAVNAGIVSPIMIIVIALTFITSLVFSEMEMVNALRYYRFIFLGAAAIFGLYGIILALFFFLIRVTSLEPFGKPYFFPIAPYDDPYFHKTLWKRKRGNENKRSSMLTDKNFTKQKGALK